MKKLQHLPQLLTLQRYSRAQEEIERSVEKQNEQFEKMTAAFKDGSLIQYRSRQDVLEAFGPPVFKREYRHDGRLQQQWLYRYATDFDGPRVYLYFDKGGTLIDRQYEPGTEDDDGDRAKGKETEKK